MAVAAPVLLDRTADPKTVHLLPRSARLIVGILLSISLLFQVAACLGGMARSLHGSTDFRAFYSAGLMLRHGQGSSLYNTAAQNAVEQQAISHEDRMLPFLYPAATAALFEPLSMLRYKTAFLLFFGVNVTLLACVCVLVLPCLETLSRWTVLLCSAALLPCAMALMQGQISFLLLAVYALAYRWEQRRPFVAGLVLSLGFVKFQILIPVVLLVFFWKRWRVCGGVLTGGLLLAAASVAITGVHGQLVYLKSTLGMAHQTALNAAGAKAAYGMFPIDMPNLHGMIFALMGDGKKSVVVLVLLSALVLGRAAVRPSGIPLALTAACLVSYHMQAYDLTLLVLPLAVIAARVPQDRSAIWRLGAWKSRRTFWAGAFAFVFLLAPVASAVMLWGRLWILIGSAGATMFALLQQADRGPSAQ